jgi:hypothetical protein
MPILNEVLMHSKQQMPRKGELSQFLVVHFLCLLSSKCATCWMGKGVTVRV